jgi:hypothetical protein
MSDAGTDLGSVEIDDFARLDMSQPRELHDLGIGGGMGAVIGTAPGIESDSEKQRGGWDSDAKGAL